MIYIFKLKQTINQMKKIIFLIKNKIVDNKEKIKRFRFEIMLSFIVIIAFIIMGIIVIFTTNKKIKFLDEISCNLNFEDKNINIMDKYFMQSVKMSNIIYKFDINLMKLTEKSKSEFSKVTIKENKLQFVLDCNLFLNNSKTNYFHFNNSIKYMPVYDIVLYNEKIAEVSLNCVFQYNQKISKVVNYKIENIKIIDDKFKIDAELSSDNEKLNLNLDIKKYLKDEKFKKDISILISCDNNGNIKLF